MQFSHFAQYLHTLEQTPSRLEMTAILAELFPQLDREEISPVCYLLQGQLLPAYTSLEFQLSVKMVIRALARLSSEYGRHDQTTTLFGERDTTIVESEIAAQYKTLGDIGLLAEQIAADVQIKRTQELSIASVYSQLMDIAREAGAGSQDRKLAQLADLFARLSPLGARYVARIIVGKLRLGFSTKTMLDSLSWSQTGTKDESAALEEALQRKADLGKLAQVYLSTTSETERAKALETYHSEEGVPIVPQLCQRLNSAEEAIEKMGEVIAEPKYDGLRVQIHLNRSSNKQPVIRAFTRNLEEVSHMFPELETLPQVLQGESVILDAEAIGYDPKTGTLLPFQATITRKRKHGVEETAATTPLRFFVFDILALNGKSFIDKKLRERKDVLSNLFSENDSFKVTKFIQTTDPIELQTFHESQLGEGLEGVVIKQIDSPYQSGRKNWYWVKIKEKTGTRGKLSDTIDCVVMGYYQGRGKRTQFGLGAILVGVRNPDTDAYVTIAKIGTGMSEEQLAELKTRADALGVSEQLSEYTVAKLLIPDYWTKPSLVVEVAADEITRSPQHSSGVALRFPRLVRFRDDKRAEDATTLEELRAIAG